MEQMLAQVLAVSGLVLAGAYVGRRSLVALLCALMILVNVASAETVTLAGLSVTVGTPLYAVTFLISNVISERYGKPEARLAIHKSFAVVGGFSLMAFALTHPALSPLAVTGTLARVLTNSLRILAASLMTYLVAQNSDVVIYHAVRRATGGRFLWLRGAVSSALAEAIDSLMFFFLAFVGTGASWFELAVGGFVVKCSVGVLLVPAQYLARRMGSREFF